MKKILVIFVILIILCFTLYFERRLNMGNIEISDDSLKVSALISKEYSEADLTSISLLDYSIFEYNKLYPIECLRKEYNNYKLVYCGDSGYLVIYFNMDGKKVFSKYFKKSVSYDNFIGIKHGTYYKDVMAIDKYGNYDSFYASSTTSFRSEHYTDDGYYIIIEYDDNLNVSNLVMSYI